MHLRTLFVFAEHIRSKPQWGSPFAHSWRLYIINEWMPQMVFNIIFTWSNKPIPLLRGSYLPQWHTLYVYVYWFYWHISSQEISIFFGSMSDGSKRFSFVTSRVSTDDGSLLKRLSAGSVLRPSFHSLKYNFKRKITKQSKTKQQK